MGSIDGQRIDYNGVGVLRGQRHISSKDWPKYPPPREDYDYQATRSVIFILKAYYKFWLKVTGTE